MAFGRYAEKVLAVIFSIITCLSCCMSNGFCLGHKVGFSVAAFLLFLSRLVVPGSTGDEGYLRLSIIIVLRSTLMICLPRELWFEVNLDLGLPLIWSGFYLCLTIICDVPNIYPWHHWIQGEVTLVLCIPVTQALVKYDKIGFEFYRLWSLSLSTVPSRLVGFSQKLAHIIRYHEIIVTFQNS